MTRQIPLVLVVTFLSLPYPAFLPESRGAEDVRVEASLTVDGRVVTDHAAALKQSPLREILAAFARAETAVQNRDLDTLTNFCAKAYNHQGLKQAEVRRICGEISGTLANSGT